MDTKAKIENPPAFPTHHVEKEPGQDPFMMSVGGMTLRDYFAAKAMQSIIMQPGRYGTAPTAYALAAYEYADAMLLARQKGAPQC